MCWHGSASGKWGRRPKYSEAAIQSCLTNKGLFNLPLRQAIGMAQNLLKLASLDWQVPDFITVRRRQKHLSVTIGAQPATKGLHLLVDSTGIKMLGEGEWKTKNQGADYRRQWRKVHLGIDADTLEIRAIEVKSTLPVMRRCCHACSTRFPPTRSSPASAAMMPTTPKAVTKRLRNLERRRLSPLAKTPSHGRIVVPAP